MLFSQPNPHTIYLLQMSYLLLSKGNLPAPFSLSTPFFFCQKRILFYLHILNANTLTKPFQTFQVIYFFRVLLGTCFHIYGRREPVGTIENFTLHKNHSGQLSTYLWKQNLDFCVIKTLVNNWKYKNMNMIHTVWKILINVEVKAFDEWFLNEAVLPPHSSFSNSWRHFVWYTGKKLGYYLKKKNHTCKMLMLKLRNVNITDILKTKLVWML